MHLKKEKSSLTNLTAFYNGMMTGLVDNRRAVDALYLDFSKAFDSVSHNILIDQLMKHKLDKRLNYQESSEEP
ncbi:hypothetical protein QYF61_010845 [Mycteria americana]|uniref:Reverse transcriptase domain-containing protein n=1 Tax=Mycteria americana TaxID=33587 RepID=A0AAN7NHD9_MYCAM|nr:hypothetical protein QYF61_010845 [Mycteria americana]